MVLLCGVLQVRPAQALPSLGFQQPSLNWYWWYIRMRGYLDDHGGLLCPAGAKVIFHQNGTLTTDSDDPACLHSLNKLNFPLPPSAQLEELNVPVRKKTTRPMSRKQFSALVQDEIQKQARKTAQKQQVAPVLTQKAAN